MSKYIKNRFGVVALLIVIFVAISFACRLVLLFTDLAQVDLGIMAMIKLFLVGLFYDVVAATYYAAPFAVYMALIPNRLFNNKIHRYVLRIFLFFQLNLLVLIGFSEWFFWDEFGKRFNFIAVDYLVYTHEVMQNIFESFPVPLLFCIIFTISLIAFYSIYKKTAILEFSSNSQQLFLTRLKIGAIFIFLPFLFFKILDQQSLSNISDNQYNNELSKNGIYSLFSAFRNNTLDYDSHYASENITTVMDNLKLLTGFDDKQCKVIKTAGKELKYNVELVMVESLSAEYMGIFGNEKGLTPHLDKVAKKSLFFDNFYATGTRTVRGMEAVILSVPPTPGRSIVKRPDNYNMFSTGFVFREKGYENKFIYAGYGYFDNMNDFFSHNGFDIIDRKNMDENEITFSNAWGVCDEDLFNRALKESDNSYQEGKPFFNTIMTTSNHRPYTYPDGKIDIPSHAGRSGGVKYTDYAIDKFLKDAATRPWFNNTIFVIVADHNGGSAGKMSLPVWRYKIPLIFYAPNIIKPDTIGKLSSQIDVMPTLFSILNWRYESKFYGQDILSRDFQEMAFIGTYQKLGFLRDKRLLVLEPDKRIHEYEIVHQALKDVEYKEIAPFRKDAFDAVTYYQSASYLYQHNLNRWKQ